MPNPTGDFAAIHYAKGFDIDALLEECCRDIAAWGVRVAGLLQIAKGGVRGCATSMHLYDLQSNTTFDIWENRGSCARGCRLDEAGLNQAANVLDRAIADRVDLLIINRFGRAESQGRGLLGYYARAIENDIPFLTSVRDPYEEAWSKFHAGLAISLPSDRSSVRDWARSVTSRRGADAAARDAAARGDGAEISTRFQTATV